MNKIIIEIAVSVFAAAVGTAGITMIYNVGRRVFIYAIIGAVLSCFAYEVVNVFLENLLIIFMIASAVAAVYSEIMAHILKIPATVTLIPAIVPLVPGRMLYYTMFGIVSGDGISASENAKGALFTSLGIALGIIIVTLITRAVFPGIISKSIDTKQKRLKFK